MRADNEQRSQWGTRVLVMTGCLRGAAAAEGARRAASQTENTKTPSPGRNAGKDEVSVQPRNVFSDGLPGTRERTP